MDRIHIIQYVHPITIATGIIECRQEVWILPIGAAFDIYKLGVNHREFSIIEHCYGIEGSGLSVAILTQFFSN